MKPIITFILIILLLVLLQRCCIVFGDLTPESSYNVGDIITTSGKEILVEKFQWGDGTWTSTGEAKVDTRTYSSGSGKDLNARNVNLYFKFEYPVIRISFKFGELGGNNNIKVNDDFKNVRDLISLNGTTLGGVQIEVNANQQGNNWYGDMILEGNINDFSIGGQELWLDNICHKK